MTRIFDAECENQIVKVAGHTVEPVVILSQGKRSSEGILAIDAEKATYVTSNAEELAEALDEIAGALGLIATALTGIGAGMPSSTPPPTLGSTVSAINAVKDALNTLKVNLK